MPTNPKPPKGTAKRERRRRLKAQRDRQYGRTPDGKDFAAFVRAQGCCVPASAVTVGCFGPIEFAHVVSRGADPARPGVGNGVGLCTAHHAMQHSLGISAFQARYGVHLRTIARALAAKWEDQHGA